MSSPFDQVLITSDGGRLEENELSPRNSGPRAEQRLGHRGRDHNCSRRCRLDFRGLNVLVSSVEKANEVLRIGV